MEYGELVKEWVEKHEPNGVVKLALKTGLSVSTIAKLKTGIYRHRKLHSRTKHVLERELERK